VFVEEEKQKQLDQILDDEDVRPDKPTSSADAVTVRSKDIFEAEDRIADALALCDADDTRRASGDSTYNPYLHGLPANAYLVKVQSFSPI
jgi:hypothetical protein